MLPKAIILIISSNDNKIYEEFKDLHRIYLKNYRYLFKYFFIEFRENQDELVIEEYDHIYVKGKESINPGMILKTCKAIEYINEFHKYEFIVRTNLSTVFHIPNLIEYLDIMYPKDKGTFKNKGKSQLLAIYLKTRKQRGQ